MTEYVNGSTTEYTIIILARTDSGEKIKLCQIEMPKNQPAKLMATTRSFAVLKGVTDMAGELIADAENIYFKDLQNDATKDG